MSNYQRKNTTLVQRQTHPSLEQNGLALVKEKADKCDELILFNGFISDIEDLIQSKLEKIQNDGENTHHHQHVILLDNESYENKV